MNILIVEDDADFAAGLAEMIELGGHCVTTERELDSAIARAMSRKIDLAFVDIKLGNDDGLAFPRAIKAARLDRRVVMLTGFHAAAYVDDALRAGALGVLQKPVTRDEINRYLPLESTRDVDSF